MIAVSNDIVADMEARLQVETDPNLRTVLELQLAVGRAFYPWLNARIEAHIADPDVDHMAATMNAVCNVTSSMFANAFRGFMLINPDSVGMALDKFSGEFCELLGMHAERADDDEPTPEPPKVN